MLIKVYGAAVQGIDATLITIEVNSSRGCMLYLVGLPDSAVKESQQRIRSALQVNGYRMPTSTITINMAPADIRKEGSAYDLPLAIGMLGATEVVHPDKLEEYLLMGELSLDGSLQPIKGALPIAIKARELGFKGLILPRQNAREAAVVNKLSVYGVENIKEELRIDLIISTGGTIRSFHELVVSYEKVIFTYKFGRLLNPGCNVYSYKDYVLIRLLSDIPKPLLIKYFDGLIEKNGNDVISDEELMDTAEEFMKNSLNISETSRNMYIHRNTLIYRLDKIEKEMGLNLRNFSDAITFRLINILNTLIKGE